MLAPEEVWLFGSRARETHGPDSDWDLMAVLPDTAPDRDLDLAAVWSSLRELRRLRIEVIPMRRRDFDESRSTLGELAVSASPCGYGQVPSLSVTRLTRRIRGLLSLRLP